MYFYLNIYIIMFSSVLDLKLVINAMDSTHGAPSLVTDELGEASGEYLGAGDVAARGNVDPRGAFSPASDTREPSDDAFAAL